MLLQGRALSVLPFSCSEEVTVQPISDRAMDTIEYALSALTLRSEVVANNVANSEVPGFTASRVSFESELRRALEGRGPEQLGTPPIEVAPGSPDATGNTVNLETEVVEMIRTNLLQQAMVEAFNFKAGVLRTAMRG
jgi:flagellar basal-body rod protein FlgB